MKLLLMIGSGSFIGGILRYLLTQLVQTKFFVGLHIGTLVVNLCGCFMIGIVFGLMNRIHAPQEWRWFLMTGLLGGFTTFSAFSNETVCLLRAGQLITAGSYIFASVFLGLIATYIGHLIAE